MSLSPELSPYQHQTAIAFAHLGDSVPQADQTMENYHLHRVTLGGDTEPAETFYPIPTQIDIGGRVHTLSLDGAAVAEEATLSEDCRLNLAPRVLIGSTAVLMGRVTVGRNAQIHGVVSQSQIGEHVSIERAAIVADSTIGNNAVLQSYAKVGQSIIDVNTTLERHAEVSDSTIGAGCTLGAFAKITAAKLRGGNVLGGYTRVETDATLDFNARLGESAIVNHGASIGLDATLGKDTEVGAEAVLHTRVITGKGVRVRDGAVIGMDSEIEDGSIIGKGAHLGAQVRVLRRSVVPAGKHYKNFAIVVPKNVGGVSIPIKRVQGV